ncbi:Zinc finger protein bud20 [Cladobotryum mycophilum]|uniref:Zinc finger protein bud20 n=1 Tax=Cladobotryum mycophilum TaxID=491253 RepID=A0ABR0SMX8_9HYPO
MGVGNKRTLTKTRRKTRDVDQTKADLLSPKHLAQFKGTKASEDLPGLGQNYCVECARWFDTQATLLAHRRGKPHKRRVKQIREEPDNHTSTKTSKTSQSDSDLAAEDDIDMAT